uniref:Uncharacterized protein n=2 Tax=Aegilops tauschii subsp. strangulata TaxID=200361 RepID=A0A453AG65_AEGTS
ARPLISSFLDAGSPACLSDLGQSLTGSSPKPAPASCWCGGELLRRRRRQACPGRHGRRRRTGGRRCCHGRLCQELAHLQPSATLVLGWLFSGSAAAARRVSGSGAGRRHRRAGRRGLCGGHGAGEDEGDGMRKGAARSEFQAVLAVVTCPQSRSKKKEKGMNLEEELGEEQAVRNGNGGNQR